YLMCKEGVRRIHIDYTPPEMLEKISLVGKKDLTPDELQDLDMYGLAASMYEIFSPNNKPLIDVSLPKYSDRQTNPNTRKMLVHELKDNIDRLVIGEEYEKPLFQQMVIRMLKSKEYRDSMRMTTIKEDDYNNLELSELVNQEDRSPIRTESQSQQ